MPVVSTQLSLTPLPFSQCLDTLSAPVAVFRAHALHLPLVAIVSSSQRPTQLLGISIEHQGQPGPVERHCQGRWSCLPSLLCGIECSWSGFLGCGFSSDTRKSIGHCGSVSYPQTGKIKASWFLPHVVKSFLEMKPLGETWQWVLKLTPLKMLSTLGVQRKVVEKGLKK